MDDKEILVNFAQVLRSVDREFLAEEAQLDSLAGAVVHANDAADGADRVMPHLTRPGCLADLYGQLGLASGSRLRFAPLFERLLLSYRWVGDIDLDNFLLFKNPSGEDLGGFRDRLEPGNASWQTLIAKGYLQFARGSEYDHDPVCFDTQRRRKDRDCPVVKIFHETLWIRGKIKVVQEIAPSFRALVLDAIQRFGKPAA